MEKIQAAIEMARKQRARGDTPPPHARTQPVAPTQEQGDVAQRWAELQPFMPSNKVLANHRMVTRKPSDEATPFDILRTKILWQMQQNNWTRLAITSPMPNSGKSTIACNLALGLSRQSDTYTMLFDLDLRSPSVGSYMGHDSGGSFSDVLTGEVPFAQQAVRFSNNLSISSSQTVDKDSSSILLSEDALNVFDDIQSDYEPDIMIFDMPSMLVGADARAFLKNTDCALIVSRANATRYAQFDRTENEIAESTNVIGVVLNACRFDSD